ncbi:1-acyl-sn-glycerol-3-phosphate acyltransferase [Palleronia abyssalis]|uniref:1-acyl-sn-glycerol-3-phosphate acyltransferase n=2 Tax=Palleronia abyssalis TaxID=1501240 RepID=A0A2R8BTR1_9RHOB|nr:1-acyl-sn-glycerol-3-phosphate acyltransferase [Palleronia abyssalis]
MIQYLRSLIFTVQMYAAMALMGLWWLPIAMRQDDGAHRAVRSYCRYVRWSAAWMIGLKSEVRGTVAEGEVMIAAKHQSFFDIIMLCSVLPAPKFIMKKELTRAPVLGWFALKMGCVPVDRGKKGQAIAKMMADVQKGRTRAGQLIIYPQGTRVAPGVKLPYKTGTAVLYGQLDQTCVPVAVNVGVFWPRMGIAKKPGLAVIEFLKPIPPGLTKHEFVEQLSTAVEGRSNELMTEAGWTRIEV